jgi:5'-nucleotidase
VDPRENTYYWVSGQYKSGADQTDTDVQALAAGYVTVTPIQYDLTRYDLLDSLQQAVKKDGL